MADYYLNSFKVSSPFGENRGGSSHSGVDFAGLTPGAADGMAIPAIMAGTVEQVFVNNKTAGNGIVIRGADGRQYRYIHMKNPPRLKVGATVSMGQSLGQIGNTGNSTGPHLDLKVVDKNGKNIDPMTIIKALSGGGGSSSSKNTTGGKTGGSSYTNTWKTQQEALKAPGYQTYKANLQQAMAKGGVPSGWAVALTELIGRESTWNAKVGNNASSAWGYGQFLSSTRKEYEKKTGLSYSDPVNQIIMTVQYVKDRYGTPEAALAHWDKKKWY